MLKIGVLLLEIYVFYFTYFFFDSRKTNILNKKFIF